MARSVARAELTAWLVVYGFCYAALFASGFRFDVRWELLQLVSPELLSQRLIESIWYLHAQPPLLNLWLGLSLEVETATGLDHRTLLATFDFLLGLGSVAFWSGIASRLIVAPIPRRICMAILVLHPVFYASLFGWFYTLHEIFLLSWLAFATLRHFDRPSPRHFAGVCAAIVLLVWTHSLFHPLWAMVYLGASLLVRRTSPGRGRERSIAVFVVLLLLAWPAKNLELFGFFGYSSWQGFNLSRGLEMGEAPIAPMFRPGASSDSVEARRLARAKVPARFAQVRVLAEPLKSPGVPNWNHFEMIAYSQSMQRRVVEHLRDHPSALFTRAFDNYLKGWALYAGRNAYFGYYDPPARDTWLAGWMRVHEGVSLLSVFADPAKGLPGPFAILFPIGLVLIARLALRDPRLRAFALVQLFTVGWVLAMVLFVDGQEGNRIRFSTEPIFWLLAAASIGGAAAGNAVPSPPSSAAASEGHP